MNQGELLEKLIFKLIRQSSFVIRPRPRTISAPSFWKTSGEILIFIPRPPPPSTTQSRCMMRSSTYSGSPRGSANGVTPPTRIPVSAVISSAEANDALGTPINLVTHLLTSRRVLARTTQATYFLGSFFEATIIVLQERSSG